MAEPLELTDIWKRTMDATVQFYGTLGELAVSFMQSLLTSATALNVETTPAPPVSARPDAPSQTPHFARPPTMVLEAERGAEAIGLFMVENQLGKTVTAAPAASAPVSENGSKLSSHLLFQPPEITLEPGQQALIRVSAPIPPKLRRGTRYYSQISVPGLLGTTIPVVVSATGAQPTSHKATTGSTGNGHTERKRSPKTRKVKRR